MRPQVGGCLSSLSFNGTPILRPMAADAAKPLESACFPLVPYCNRIAEGRFRFAGRDVILPPNFAPERHPLHGLGWQRPWDVVQHDEASIELQHVYDGDDEWPWSYQARLRVCLDEAGCTIALQAENTSDEIAPLGLGLHPYFRRSSEARLAFLADGMLGTNDEFLPDGTVHPADALACWRDGAAFPADLVDHCFTGWDGKARISDRSMRIELHATGAPNAHVFAPPGKPFACIEPVNHEPDALNRDDAAMPAVAPGNMSTIALRIEAVVT